MSFFRFRKARQPTAGANEFAFLGTPGAPAFLPMGTGVLNNAPWRTFPDQGGVYTANNRGVAQQALAGVVTGGMVMAPLDARAGYSVDGIAAALE